MAAVSVDDVYDYIVVGSGAGGGPVAANLADAGYRVLVLEAGGDAEPPEYQVPAFHALSTEHHDLAWNFFVRHDARRTDVFYPRAGTLGGCTAHHALIFVAPHDHDWNQIAALTGDGSWRARRMQKYFRRLERCGYVRRPWSRWLNRAGHGFDGWLPTTVADPSLLLRDLVLARLVAAAAQTCFAKKIWYTASPWQIENWSGSFLDPTDWSRAGLASRSLSWLTSFIDPNDRRRLRRGGEGFILVPMTTRRGARFGTRERIRETVQRRPDRLTVRLNALVTRVILDADKRAVGVEYLEGARLYRAHPSPAGDDVDAPRRTVRASREVILAGGSFNTPQILMLSGIGAPDELARHGIKVEVPLPGVGRNLQDRYEIGVVHQMRKPFDILEDSDLRPHGPNFEEWRQGYGLYTTNGVVAGIVKRSHHGRTEPDLFLFAIPGEFSGYFPGYSELGRQKDKFTWLLLKGHTNNSAGRVTLASADPRDRPHIDFRYFDEGNDACDDDLDGVVGGIEFIREITKRTAGVFEEKVPGRNVRTRAELAEFVKANAWGHHACGTCKIGYDADPQAVLDSRFRVRGTIGLRVVDASAFPSIPGFFILSAVYMIAEKASDTIVRDARRGPPGRAILPPSAA